MAKQPVRIFISGEGKEHYRNSVQQSGQDSYDAGKSILNAAGKADGYVEVYGELYIMN